MNEFDFLLYENEVEEENEEQTFDLEQHFHNNSVSSKELFEAHFYKHCRTEELEISPENSAILDSAIQELVKSLRA